MKLLIYKNGKWQNLVMKWNYKAKEKPKFELTEEKDGNTLKLLKLKKETKSAIACVNKGKVVAFREKKPIVKPRAR